jgi:hypothetical protein
VNSPRVLVRPRTHSRLKCNLIISKIFKLRVDCATSLGCARTLLPCVTARLHWYANVLQVRRPLVRLISSPMLFSLRQPCNVLIIFVIFHFMKFAILVSVFTLLTCAVLLFLACDDAKNTLLLSLLFGSFICLYLRAPLARMLLRH